PDRDAEHGDQRDERDERLLAARQQIADGDEELEGQIHVSFRLSAFSYQLPADRFARRFKVYCPQTARLAGERHLRARISGNRMTSRIDALLVSSITSRSMPTPSPAVGGR